jgi:predicted metalloendopeptidase
VPGFRPSITLAAVLFVTAPALLPPARAATPKQPAAHGIVVANMDPSVKPGNDFYLYANGGWIARTKIPADRARIGQGSAFDAAGGLRNWWTPTDCQHFDQEAKALEEQYDAYEALPGLHVNGEQTIDEDIADLGGVAAAYEAYHDSLNGRAAPSVGGFTGDQQFFIAFGQNWGSKVRPAALRNQVLTDSHAPARSRAATVRNADAWYTAFDVKPGEALYLPPDERVRIW